MQTLLATLTQWQNDPDFCGLWIVPDPKKSKRPYAVKSLDFNTTSHQFQLVFKANNTRHMALVPDSGLQKLFDTHLVATLENGHEVVILNGQFYPQLPKPALLKNNPAKPGTTGVVH